MKEGLKYICLKEFNYEPVMTIESSYNVLELNKIYTFVLKANSRVDGREIYVFKDEDELTYAFKYSKDITEYFESIRKLKIKKLL